MDPLPRFNHSFSPNQVCKLNKALYGLKQVTRAWFERFIKIMILIGYRQSQKNHILFIKHSTLGRVIVLIVYANDIIIIGNDLIEKNMLRKKTSCKIKNQRTRKTKIFS